jgi:hypothetical protein
LYQQPCERVVTFRRLPLLFEQCGKAFVPNQVIGVKVVECPKRQPAPAHVRPWREPLHDRLEGVQVDLLGRAARERWPLGRGRAAEIANQQQPHRLAVVSRSRTCANSDIELEPVAHQWPPLGGV